MTREPGDLPSLAKAAIPAVVTEVDAMTRTAAPAVHSLAAPAPARFAGACAAHGGRPAMGLPCR